MGKCLFEPNYSQIVPNLWLGNYEAASDHNFFKNKNIKLVINITKDIPNFFFDTNVKYLKIPVDDDNLCNKNLNKLFDYLTFIIHNCLNRNVPVFVHCKRGHHRSACVVIAYLIKYLNYPLNEAIKYINSLRYCAMVRQTCMTRALILYYNHIKKINH
jgi:protein-tyrosine phosphatase